MKNYNFSLQQSWTRRGGLRQRKSGPRSRWTPEDRATWRTGGRQAALPPRLGPRSVNRFITRAGKRKNAAEHSKQTDLPTVCMTGAALSPARGRPLPPPSLLVLCVRRAARRREAAGHWTPQWLPRSCEWKHISFPHRQRTDPGTYRFLFTWYRVWLASPSGLQVHVKFAL